jgi:uncharacterized protein (TIGR03083 family)
MTFDWPAELEREGDWLGNAAAADLTAAIPAAPGWNTAELLRHVGLLYVRSSVILRTGTLERPSRKNGMLPDPPADGVLEWYRANLADLLVDIRAIEDPDRRVYSFAPAHQRAGFWPRRMAHETAVHRVDAEQAVGRAIQPIAPDFAADGIDELFTVFVPALGAGRSPGDGRSVHVHATDADSEWVLRFEPGDAVAAPAHAKSDATVRGPAAELLLWLWGRRPLGDMEVLGDRDAAERLRQLTTF